MNPALGLLLVAGVLPTRSGPPVAAEAGCPSGVEIAVTDAPRCVGREKRVVGRLDHVYRTPNGTRFLNFCSDWKNCSFAAVVRAPRASTFGGVEGLAGSTVAVSGTIEIYKGRAEIVLDRPDQLLVRSRPPTPPAVPPAVQPAEPSRSSSARREDPPAEESRSAPPTDVVARSTGGERGRGGGAAPRPATPPLVRPISAANSLVGQPVRLRGRVARIDFWEQDLAVYFTQPDGRESPFVGVVPEAELERLAETAQGWDGQLVTVEGTVEKRDKHPVIVIHNAAQVSTERR